VNGYGSRERPEIGAAGPGVLFRNNIKAGEGTPERMTGTILFPRLDSMAQQSCRPVVAGNDCAGALASSEGVP
jgi:hypothetical protein